MRVLSLFDGIACGRVALERAGVPVDSYFASEIDPHCITVAKQNHRDIEHIGDVRGIDDAKVAELGKIDLLLAGSPCQGFSRASAMSGTRTGMQHERSGLYTEFLRVFNLVKPRYFLLENVIMKEEYVQRISDDLGVRPMPIDSALFSAQRRPRLYWTNIGVAPLPPKDSSTLRSILVPREDVPRNYYLSPRAIEYMERKKGGRPRWRSYQNRLDDKSACVTAVCHKGAPYGVVWDLKRRLCPVELERLQTLPDDYTSGVAATHRLKSVGNGWTVDVIAHILHGLV